MHMLQKYAFNQKYILEIYGKYLDNRYKLSTHITSCIALPCLSHFYSPVVHNFGQIPNWIKTCVTWDLIKECMTFHTDNLKEISILDKYIKIPDINR